MLSQNGVAGQGELDGKVALIVGSASGIGKATAEVFAREGAQLIIADVQEEEGRNVTSALNKQTLAIFSHVDIRKADSVQEMVVQARNQFKKLNIVVNSAGIEGVSAPLHELSVEDFDEVISVNLRGIFLVMKYTIPWLLESGGGSIVNVASAAGMVGAAMMSAYCSAKGGLIQLDRVAAIDYAVKGIRVNSICPGNVDTPMMRREFSTRPNGAPGLSTFEKMDNLVNYACDPIEIAETILFMSGDRAHFMIGTEVVVDGGKLTR